MLHKLTGHFIPTILRDTNGYALGPKSSCIYSFGSLSAWGGGQAGEPVKEDEKEMNVRRRFSQRDAEKGRERVDCISDGFHFGQRN